MVNGTKPNGDKLIKTYRGFMMVGMTIAVAILGYLGVMIVETTKAAAVTEANLVEVKIRIDNKLEDVMEHLEQKASIESVEAHRIQCSIIYKNIEDDIKEIKILLREINEKI